MAGFLCISPSLVLLPFFNTHLVCPTPPGLKWGREKAEEAERSWGALAGMASSGHGRCFHLTLSLMGTFMDLSEPPSPPPPCWGISHHPFPWHRQIHFDSSPRALGTRGQTSGFFLLRSLCLSKQFSWVGSKSSPHCLSYSCTLVFRGSKLLPHHSFYPVFRPLLPTLALLISQA